jgi:hypothetical protein
MINYIVKPKPIAPGSEVAGGYVAQTVQSEDRTIADFVRTMTSLRGGVTEGEAAQWLDLVIRSFIFELSQGRAVNIKGFINAHVEIRGSLPNAEATFDPARNSLHVSVTVSRDVTRAIAGSPTGRVSDAASGIYIEHVHDAASNTDDSTLTPGMVLKIFGSKIKLAGDAPTVGVTFLDADGEPIQVAPAAISHNTDREIDLVTPNLSPGTYLVRVTTMYSGSTRLLAATRSYTFPTVLTVGTGS